MNKTFLALGSNLQNPILQVKAAITKIAELSKTKLITTSSLYCSAPIGFLEQPDFINVVIEIETLLSADILLQRLLAIEEQHQRERKLKNGPRTLDIDILLYGQEKIDQASLQIPHPRMTERAFVLLPLAEIAPFLVLPCGNPISYWLQKLGPLDGIIYRIKEEERVEQ